MEILNRYRGCLLGLAVGDAVGTTLEFNPPGTFQPIEDIVGGGPFGLRKGQWTDDTSMALCLAESIIEKKGFDPVDQMGRYYKWYSEGYLSSTGICFDIGGTVEKALLDFAKTGEPFCGSTDPNTAGNGSLMRLAPVPLFYAEEYENAIIKSGESSRTTHGAETAISACRYFGALLAAAVNGIGKEELLSEHYCPIPGFWNNKPLHPEIEEVARGSFKRKNPPEIIGSGYVVKSLEAALWAFYNSQDFRDGCLLAANLGDDADTTAAIYGQIAGAYYGERGIPEDWREAIACKELICSYAEKLYSCRL